jgi:biopolymer transport protein ExbB
MKKSWCLVTLVALVPALAHAAWWNEDWKQRTEVGFNTSASGVPVQEPVSGLAVPVRLHSGNFDFVSAKPDGSDLRVMAGDDKTPLKFWIERFDGVNELAVLWVQIPTLLPGTDKNTIYVYGGNEKASADANAPGTAASVADTSTVFDVHFSEKDGVFADQSGEVKATAAGSADVNGLIGPSARVSGAAISWPDNPKTDFPPGAPFTVVIWVKPDNAQGVIYHQGDVQLGLAGGHLTAKLGSSTVGGGEVAASVWSQVALVVDGGRAHLYVNGELAGEGAVAATLTHSGGISVGEGFQGLIDELQLISVARSADWVKLSYAAQSADAKLVVSKTDSSATATSSGSNSYFGILFKSLTPDAWVVIGILMVMFLVAAAVMVLKAGYIGRTAKANRSFLEQFRTAEDVMMLNGGKANDGLADSSLYRLYSAGHRELVRRDIGKSGAKLSGASLDAGYTLNSLMVLLTIAISGGPFLGLLGTVIGVMITFASIAAAGDVNVNAIAPGIAAALLATVAGLAVAIPSLFGYNYLASRIKLISSDMQIFVDEFVTRVAEKYGDG